MVKGLKSNAMECHHNHNLQTSKAPLKSQAQGTSLFTSAASNQRGCPRNSPWEAPVRLPEGERRQIRHYTIWITYMGYEKRRYNKTGNLRNVNTEKNGKNQLN